MGQLQKQRLCADLLMRSMIRPYAGGIYAASGIGPCAKGMTPERLRMGGGELGMPLGQRIAHVPPEGRRRIRDLGGKLLVGTGDVLPKVKAGNVRAPAFARARWRRRERCW